MTDNIENVDGILGNFERRRQIEKEVAESRSVGRDRPRQREISPGSPTWNEIHTEERLVDENGWCLGAEQACYGKNPVFQGVVTACKDVPPVVGQSKHGQHGQKEEDGPDPVNDGLENAHEKGRIGCHGTPLLGVELGLFFFPAFTAASVARVEADVLDHPEHCVAKGGEKEEARKKEAEQKSQDQNQGMYAQPSNDVLRLPQ
jgi:hypothetical protein